MRQNAQYILHLGKNYSKNQVVNDTLSKLLTLHRFENDGWSLVDI